MNKSDYSKMIAAIRKQLPNQIASELVSVQPMPNDIGQKLYSEGKSEEWLKENGCRPVDGQTKLLWVKVDG